MDEKPQNPQKVEEEPKVETFEAVPLSTPVEKASGLALTALICGILSFCCCGMIAGIPAIVIGWLENNNIKNGKSSEKGKWMALTGLILGFVSILMTCIWLGWYFLYGGMAVMSAFRPY